MRFGATVQRVELGPRSSGSQRATAEVVVPNESTQTQSAQTEKRRGNQQGTTSNTGHRVCAFHRVTARQQKQIRWKLNSLDFKPRF